jgi:hypothetical protein
MGERAYAKMSAVMSMRKESRSPVFHLKAKQIRRPTSRIQAQNLLCEALMDLLVVVAAQVFEEEVSFGTQLHVAVLDAVVHHLGVMTAASVADPVAARGS